MAPNVGNIRDSARISQLNRSGDKGVLELIREDLTIKSDNPMGSFKGSRSSQEVLDYIEGNETINLNRPIGFLKCRRQLA